MKMGFPAKKSIDLIAFSNTSKIPLHFEASFQTTYSSAPALNIAFLLLFERFAAVEHPGQSLRVDVGKSRAMQAEGQPAVD